MYVDARSMYALNGVCQCYRITPIQKRSNNDRRQVQDYFPARLEMVNHNYRLSIEGRNLKHC